MPSTVSIFSNIMLGINILHLLSTWCERPKRDLTIMWQVIVRCRRGRCLIPKNLDIFADTTRATRSSADVTRAFPKKTRDIEPLLVQYWAGVIDAGPTLIELPQSFSTTTKSIGANADATTGLSGTLHRYGRDDCGFPRHSCINRTWSAFMWTRRKNLIIRKLVKIVY